MWNSPLLHLDDPTCKPDPAVLNSPGGYLWWYVDLLDAAGDGLVLIGAWGLPFLPGYAAASRRGRPQTPRSRPSLNIVTYASGRPTFYLLQEQRPSDAQWAGGTLRFGESVLRSHVFEGRRHFEALLDCPLPGTLERLRGGVSVEGPAVQSFGPGEGSHRWTPLAGPATGAAHLTVGDRPLLRVEGPAYHDRNVGLGPLSTQGLSRWCWGRTVTADALHAWYALWPTDPAEEPDVLGVTIDAQGRADFHSQVTLEASPTRRSRYGPRWSPALTLRRGGQPWLHVTQEPPVDDGPFYLRHRLQVRVGDQPALPGWGEQCVPGAIDRFWERPLVRMRVHRPGRATSLWNPLFTGLLSERARRQARALTGLGPRKP